MARLLGSVSDQVRWLFAAAEERPPVASNLIALIRGSNGFRGNLRLFGYKSLILLQHLPGFDRRALSFTNPVQDSSAAHVLSIAPAKGVKNA
jgi:hypothetical protein